MHPLITAAAVELADTTAVVDGPLGLHLYRFSDRGRYALDAAVRVAQDAVQRRGIETADLDFIGSLCMSPNMLAYERDICGPRLCHPLQKELHAPKAWCVDFTDASIDSAIELAWSYLTVAGKRFGLVVRSEIASSIEPCGQSGFAWSEGAGALLLENRAAPSTAGIRAMERGQCDLDLSPCAMTWNEAISSLDQPVGILSFVDASPARAALNEAVAAAGNAAPALLESWLGDHGAGGDIGDAGPLSLFHWLTEPAFGVFDRTYFFNPFRMELSWIGWQRHSP